MNNMVLKLFFLNAIIWFWIILKKSIFNKFLLSLSFNNSHCFCFKSLKNNYIIILKNHTQIILNILSFNLMEEHVLNMILIIWNIFKNINIIYHNIQVYYVIVFQWILYNINHPEVLIFQLFKILILLLIITIINIKKLIL